MGILLLDRRSNERAPTEDRWSWWIEKRHSLALVGLPIAEVDRVIDALCTECPGGQGLVRVAQALQRATRPEILLDRWCERDVELFRLSLERSCEELGDAGRRMLVRALRRAKFSAPSFDFAAEMRELLNAGQPLSMLEEVYRDFPALDAATVEALSDMLVRAEAVEFRSFGLRILQYRRQVPRQEAFRIVTVALRDGLWVESWDCIWSVLHETEAEARKDPELVAVLEERVCGALDSEQAYVLGNSEWYIEHVLEMIVANDVAHRQRLVKRLVRTRNSWRDPAVKLARSASQKG